MLYSGSVTVTTAGTRVPLLATTTDHAKRVCCAIIIQNQKTGNTGAVFIGDVTVSSTKGISLVNPGDILTVPAMTRNVYDLATIYADAATNGNVVQFYYTVA